MFKKKDRHKNRYKTAFSEKLGKLKGFQANIQVNEIATPKICKARKVPFVLEDVVIKELRRLEEADVIRSIPTSQWSSPIVIVLKADNQLRIWGDFKKKINPHVNTEQYPLPATDDLFQRMQRGKTFTKLDLKTAYLQMVYLVISTIDGLKEFKRMPYGITSGPAIFQKKGINWVEVPMTVVNIDDILISGETDEQHVENLTLAELELTVNFSKCKSFVKEIEYAGFILSQHGIRTNPTKIKAVVDAPIPVKVTQLQSFLGWTNY